MDNYENNYEGYEHLRLYPAESTVTTAIKGIIGAVGGAVPGMALWILLGKIGIVASLCGLVLAAGIVLGYEFMTKKGELPLKFGAVLCLVVLLITIYLSQKIVWTWVLADAFQSVLPTMRDRLLEQAELEGYELTREQLDMLITDDMLNEAIRETYGFTEGTFSECYSHFHDLLEVLEVKSDYYVSLGKSYLFAFVGGGAMFFKFSATS